MIKKVILLCVLIGIVVAAVIFFLPKQKAEIKSDVLSDRAKEFIDEQKSENESDWKFARLDKNADKAGSFIGQRQQVGNCFSFVMVFRVHNPREDGKCNWYFGIEKPRGFITAYMVDAKGIKTPEQIDGVSMRQKFKEKYQEEKRVVNGVTYLIFKGKSGVYEVNVFALYGEKALTFNVVTTSPDNFDNEFNTMLESIEFDS